MRTLIFLLLFSTNAWAAVECVSIDTTNWQDATLTTGTVLTSLEQRNFVSQGSAFESVEQGSATGLHPTSIDESTLDYNVCFTDPDFTVTDLTEANVRQEIIDLWETLDANRIALEADIAEADTEIDNSEITLGNLYSSDADIDADIDAVTTLDDLKEVVRTRLKELYNYEIARRIAG